MRRAAALLLPLIVLVGCPRKPVIPPVAHPGAGDRPAPLTQLVEWALPLEGHQWLATCELELTRPEGDLAARLEQRARVAQGEGGDYDVQVENRFDDRYRRGGLDSMRAVRVGRDLAVRRQQEAFARVPDLHGEAERLRRAGFGVLPALVGAFARSARREGDRLVLVIEEPAQEAAAPPVPRLSTWAETLTHYARGVRGQGALRWPEGEALPREGDLAVEAIVNGHPLRATCQLELRALTDDERPRAPDETVSLERSRWSRDLDRLLEGIAPAPTQETPAP